VNKKLPLPPLDEMMAPFRLNFAEAARQFVASTMSVKTSDPVLVERIVADMSSAPPSAGTGAALTMNGRRTIL
jgi:hypothetical protein